MYPYFSVREKDRDKRDRERVSWRRHEIQRERERELIADTVTVCEKKSNLGNTSNSLNLWHIQPTHRLSSNGSQRKWTFVCKGITKPKEPSKNLVTQHRQVSLAVRDWSQSQVARSQSQTYSSAVGSERNANPTFKIVVLILQWYERSLYATVSIKWNSNFPPGSPYSLITYRETN